jgi:hypothetical protein
MLPIEGHLVVDVTRRHAHSALPGSPQQTEPEQSPRRAARPRHTAARILRRVADWLEPPRCTDRSLRPSPR